MFTTETIHENLAALRREYLAFARELAQKAVDLYPDNLRVREEWLREEASKTVWVTEPHRAAVVFLVSSAAKTNPVEIAGPLPKLLELAAHAALWQDAANLCLLLPRRATVAP
jgi:hypothetical protein